ncbi:MAG: DNA-3-methyladenine glycosylase family protein [Pseudomonadota bacterium]
MARVELELVGAGGEPVDFWRTVNAHGVTDLLPNRIDADARSVELTLRPGPRTVVVREARPGLAAVTGRAPRQVLGSVRHVLRLDEDLSELYELLARDADLAWAADGAGRLMRSETVFEDVVKTICTTNCAWSGTVRMVTALVEGLGEESDLGRHAFPTPTAMADAPEAFYRDVARTGYRGAYLRSLAASVASGDLDLELLGVDRGLPDDEVERRLLALPGVGPYAAAHVMMVLGRYTPLVLDSWTRPTYARLVGRKASDRAIERRFRRYGRYAGLAFWLYLTRDWVEDAAAPA